jgi:hypothetical protein
MERLRGQHKMAHWAELDENNVVIRVTVGDNNDSNGDEGYQWLIDNLGGRWVKTSYNNNIRGIFAGPGMVYQEDQDRFIPGKPSDHPSFIWSEEDYNWVHPIAKPTEDPDTLLFWDEPSLSWKRYSKETLQEVDL